MPRPRTRTQRLRRLAFHLTALGSAMVLLAILILWPASYFRIDFIFCGTTTGWRCLTRSDAGRLVTAGIKFPPGPAELTHSTALRFALRHGSRLLFITLLATLAAVLIGGIWLTQGGIRLRIAKDAPLGSYSMHLRSGDGAGAVLTQGFTVVILLGDPPGGLHDIALGFPFPINWTWRAASAGMPALFAFQVWYALLLLIPIACLLRCDRVRRRRREADIAQVLCRTCGYDLRGHAQIPDPRCPECGTAVSASISMHRSARPQEAEDSNDDR